MWTRESETKRIYFNWVAVLTYAASLAASLAIWTGVFRALGCLVK